MLMAISRLFEHTSSNASALSFVAPATIRTIDQHIYIMVRLTANEQYLRNKNHIILKKYLPVTAQNCSTRSAGTPQVPLEVDDMTFLETQTTTERTSRQTIQKRNEFTISLEPSRFSFGYR
jgi:hypothetical protein